MEKIVFAKGKAGKKIKSTALIIIFLLTAFLPLICSPVSATTPHPIYGYAQKSNGGSADGAFVKVTSSEGTKTTYVGPAGGWESGYWQVDVGGVNTSGWPDGTNFTVTITLNGTDWYSDPYQGTVNGTKNNVGTITLKFHGGGGGSSGSTPPAEENQPPVADADGPYQGYVNTTITFDGSESYDPDGSIVNYTWDFGDDAIGYGMKPEHSYTHEGTFTVTLTVTDDSGAEDSNTTTVTIKTKTTEEQNPVADPDGPYIGIVNVSVIFDGSASYDPDGFITNWTWDFGDGSFGYGVKPSHIYTAANKYTVALTVTDDDNLTNMKTTTVTVYEGNPVDIPNGYVIDTDGDGELDEFYNESSKEKTVMKKTENGTYLIDVDGDGEWDYVYDPSSGEITPYKPKEGEGVTWIWMIIGIILVVVISLIIILFKKGILYIEFDNKKNK